MALGELLPWQQSSASGLHPGPSALCTFLTTPAGDQGRATASGLRVQCSPTLELAAFPLGSVPKGVSCTQAPTGSPMPSLLPAEVFTIGNSSAPLKDILADT